MSRTIEVKTLAQMSEYCRLTPEQFESGEVFELVRQALRAAGERKGRNDEDG